MDESNFPEEIRNWEHPPWYGNVNSRRKSRKFSWRIRRVSSTTSWLISGCRWSDKMIFGPCQETSFPPSRWTQSQTLLAERRIIPCSTEIHWRLQNCSYQLGCYARTSHRWLLETSMGQEIWSDSWTGFTQFALLEENLSDGYMWSGGRLTRRQLTSRPDHLWPELWRNWEEMLSWRRSRNGPMKNPNSIMPEDYEEFISLTLGTRIQRNH